MVQFDNQYRQVKLKVVYYGPGLCGKTTCLQYIHRVTDPQRRTKLYALNTATDRTLFFDLLGIDLGRVRGYRLTLQLYTVPGQVQYNATRRAVLAGCDGVVFVADSQRSQLEADRESLSNLTDNLQSNGLDPSRTPTILQYNKRDLSDVASREELDGLLNDRSLPVFETVATAGTGVMEGFAAITEATVLSVADRLGLSSQADALQRLVANVRMALQPLTRKGSEPEVEAPITVRPLSNSENFQADELVGEAVRANLTMTDLNARLDQLGRDLEQRAQALRSINDFARAMTLTRSPEEVTKSLLDTLLATLRAPCGAVLLADEQGELKAAIHRGMATDPLLRQDPSGHVPGQQFLASRESLTVRVNDIDTSPPSQMAWLEEIRGLSLVAGLSVPLLAQDRALGLLTAYADAGRGPFGEEELELAGVLATTAAVAYANAMAWRSLDELNQSLERMVAERTRELAKTLEQARSLADQLEERNLALEAANRQLRELERLKGELLDRIAHELNTPVTAIQTAAHILGKYAGLPADKAARFVEIITTESTRLAELISSALQAAVLGVADTRPAKTNVPLTDLLKRVLVPFKGEIAAHKLVVQVKMAAGLDHVFGDEEQLEAALRAIVKNAVDFNRQGGSLVVTARTLRRGSGPTVEIKIEDTGVGISPDDLPHVFNVFWQGGNVLTDKPRGLGLGLAVAQRVAENHGGSLEIVSEQGKGTGVALYLPPPPAA